MGNLFNTLLVYPIINILVFVYQGFSAIHLPFAFGFSIIALTAIIRIILYPLMASQLRASKKMQDLHPHLSNLKEKHKGDAKRIQEETMKLYKEHGVNPAAGCLPILIQFPLLIALYNVLSHIVALSPAATLAYINGIVYVPWLRLEAPWNTSFFGVPLGAHPSQLVSAMPFILLVPILTALFQFIQSKMMMAATAQAAIVPAQKKPFGKAQGKKEEGKKGASEDFAKTFQAQSLYIFPLMLGYLAYSFPLGLSLYWNTFTLFGILQQYQISGFGGLHDWNHAIKRLRGKK